MWKEMSYRKYNNKNDIMRINEIEFEIENDEEDLELYDEYKTYEEWYDENTFGVEKIFENLIDEVM